MRWFGVECRDGRVIEVMGPYRHNGVVTAMSARQQLDWCKSLGGRLPTPEEFDAVWACADIRVSPVPRDVVRASLVSLDEDVTNAGGNAGHLVCCGKTWVQSDLNTAYRVVNYGWHVEPADVVAGKWRGIPVKPSHTGQSYVIQGGRSAPHGWTHVDYSQVGYCVRLESGVDPEPPSTKRNTPRSMRVVPWHHGVDLRELTIGMRCIMWLGFQSGLNIRESPGVQHDKTIVGYSKHCRRGGMFLGLDRYGDQVWDGGYPLPLYRDEDPWCAAITSASLLASLLPGADEVPPHGLRVSVRELCEDARRVNTLRPPSYQPVPGDLAIEARANEDPTKGGKGHVRCVVQVDGDRYLGIGGNESNRIQIAWHPLRKPSLRAWIRRQ